MDGDTDTETPEYGEPGCRLPAPAQPDTLPEAGEGGDGADESESSEWSRRKVLEGTGTVAAGLTGASVIASGSSARPWSSRRSREVEHVRPLSSDDPFDQPGHPSREAYRVLAESEREHQLKMRSQAQQQGGNGGDFGSPTIPNFSNVLNAVEDLGADPTGNEPVDGIISSNSQSGTLLVFPKGKYKLTGAVQASASGTFGLVGEGWKNANGPPSPGEGATFVAAPGSIARINYSAQSGILGNFILDQHNTNASISFVVGSSGFTTARDIAIRGVVDDVGSKADEAANHVGCALIADSGATARVTRYASIGTGLPGDKNSGGVPAIWVGDGNRGTAQIVNCVVANAADNGIYGSRTPGDTQIVGGRYSNNEVSQIRYCGQGSFADGVTCIFDADKFKGPTDDTWKYNEKFAVNPVKIEQPSHINKPGGAILRNADIQALTRGPHGGGAVVFIRGHGGALKVDNCRIADGLPMPTILAEVPGSSYDPASPPPHNINVKNCLIEGNDPNDVIDIRGRGNSSVVDTCLKITGASQQSISGASTTNVGYGQNCTKKQGLSDPSLVGSSNLTNISIPPGNFTSGGGGFNPAKRILHFLTAIVGVVYKVLVNAIAFIVILLLILGSAIIGGYLLYKKILKEAKDRIK